MQNRKSQVILIIEDSNEDFDATIRAFKKSRLSNPVRRCKTGDEALEYLDYVAENKNPENYPRPGIILMDLNLPGTDGRDIIKYMNGIDSLKLIPVVILTTSDNENDIKHCYLYGANSYIQKPVSIEGFINAINLLKEYWFEIVILPEE